MAIAKLTIFFDQPSHSAGWSETYYKTTVNTSPGALEGAARALIVGRMPLSGINTVCRFFRISVNTGIARISRLFETPNEAPYDGNKDNDSDNPTTCLDVQLENADGSRVKYVYLRGVWDNVVTDGGAYDPGPIFKNFFDSWVVRLLNGGWGWQGKNELSKKLPIKTLTQAANGQVLITTDLELTPAGLNKSMYPLRVSRVKSPGNLNGVVTYTINSPTSFQSVPRIPIFPWDSTGFIAYNANSVISINSGRVVRVGERKVGRPFGSVRGRAPNRIRG